MPRITLLDERGFHLADVGSEEARKMVGLDRVAMPHPNRKRTIIMIEKLDVSEPPCFQSHGSGSSCPTGGYLQMLAMGHVQYHRDRKDFIERDYGFEKRVIGELQVEALVQCGAVRRSPCSVDMHVA